MEDTLEVLPLLVFVPIAEESLFKRFAFQPFIEKTDGRIVERRNHVHDPGVLSDCRCTLVKIPVLAIGLRELSHDLINQYRREVGLFKTQ